MPIGVQRTYSEQTAIENLAHEVLRRNKNTVILDMVTMSPPGACGTGIFNVVGGVLTVVPLAVILRKSQGGITGVNGQDGYLSPTVPFRPSERARRGIERASEPGVRASR